ncbi:CHRD domain-containing protein [Bacillus sp. TL12]|uniref:CHRD domain-containing protein n=1 Tax=Bacillus sp. TL12 TaxID=2894756 RepID=UPI001F519AD9|nr:CHRD domain-containing protein [Bacillus sp. TL12]MCI0765841.1 CHRD domain-containing protein [Bacillus sp. TL12]
MSTCFISKLTGREEVPPVYTDAQFRFNNDFMKLQFKLVVHDIEQVTAAHIHLGDRGVVTGTISETDLVGPLQNMSLLELANRMNTGNTYVNVHTEKHPPGQIRGQIRRF